METFDDFRRRRFGGDSAASSSAFCQEPERATAALLRQRLHTIYEMPADELPDAFRVLLTQMSKLDNA